LRLESIKLHCSARERNKHRHHTLPDACGLALDQRYGLGPADWNVQTSGCVIRYRHTNLDIHV
jgi:hypothetical protein